MLRNLMTATAVLALLAGPALAQNSNAPAETNQPAASETTDDAFIQNVDQGDSLTSRIIGMGVYASSSPDAESIGDINDVVLGPEGEVKAVVVGVGGFLGIGEKDVAVDWDEIELGTDEDGESFAVFASNKEALEAAPAFERPELTTADASADTEGRTATGTTTVPVQTEGQTAAETTTEQPAQSGQQMAAETTTEQPAQSGQQMAAETTTEQPAEGQTAQTETTTVPVQTEGTNADTAAQGEAVAPDQDMAAGTGDREGLGPQIMQPREGFVEVQQTKVSVDDLIGANVYTSEDEDIAEINDVILDADGRVDVVVIDFGGWLGIGSKPIAVRMSDLQLVQDEAGEMYVYTDIPRESFEAAAEYDKDAYEANRDSMTVSR